MGMVLLQIKVMEQIRSFSLMTSVGISVNGQGTNSQESTQGLKMDILSVAEVQRAGRMATPCSWFRCDLYWICQWHN